MAIAAYFQPKAMTYDQYLEIHRRLEAAGVGLGNQDGRLHHSCFGDDGSLAVYDIWESPEQFEAFGAKLQPILAEMGVEMSGPPAVMPVQFMDQRGVEGSL